MGLREEHENQGNQSVSLALPPITIRFDLSFKSNNTRSPKLPQVYGDIEKRKMLAGDEENGHNKVDRLVSQTSSPHSTNATSWLGKEKTSKKCSLKPTDQPTLPTSYHIPNRRDPHEGTLAISLFMWQFRSPTGAAAPYRTVPPSQRGTHGGGGHWGFLFLV